MTPITMNELKQRSGQVRKAMEAGRELAVTFHDRPIGVLVPHEQFMREREELALLRQIAASAGIAATMAVPA